MEMKRLKIKDLKERIKNLPDDMSVLTYQEAGSGGYHVTILGECKTLYAWGEDIQEKERQFESDRDMYKPKEYFVIG